MDHYRTSFIVIPKIENQLVLPSMIFNPTKFSRINRWCKDTRKFDAE